MGRSGYRKQTYYLFRPYLGMLQCFQIVSCVRSGFADIDDHGSPFVPILCLSYELIVGAPFVCYKCV